MNANLEALDAGQLETGLRNHLGREREANVEFLLYLGEFEARRLHERHGYPSIWEYCRRELGLIEGSIHYRKTAARLMRRFPIAVEMMRDGRLCMTGLSMLDDELTDDNASALLAESCGKSKREIEELIARRHTAPIEPVARLRALPAPRQNRNGPEACATVGLTSPESVEPVPVTANPERERDRGSLKPLTATQYKLEVTVDAAFAEKLAEARDALSHVVPDGNLADVLLRSLEEVLRKHAKRSTPTGKEAEPTDSGAVSAEVERQVRDRDGNRCAWKKPDGSACGSTWQLEIDHIRPKALGGASTVENCRVLCRAHNQQHAREVFGESLFQKSG